MPQKPKEQATASHKALTVVGIVLCIILIPILIINVTLIVKSYTNEDEVPKIGGYAPLIVLTGSMEPNIMSGDLIFVKQVNASEIKERDVIAFFDPEGNGISILTHRVTKVYEENGTIYFRTMGDANNAEDRTAVSADKLVGIYTEFRIPGAGRVAMFMQTTAGLIVCVVVPLILLVGWDIYRRRRYEKKNQQDTTALLAELEALKAEKAAQGVQNTAAQDAIEEFSVGSSEPESVPESKDEGHIDP